MHKTFSVLIVGIAAAGVGLAMPAESQARDFHIRIGGYGDSCGFGGYSSYRGGGFGLGYSDYGYRSSGFGLGYSSYGSGFRHYDDYGYRSYSRPVIVHPETYHYSPFSGFHSHGHMHVPHRGHYHTIPY